LQPQITPLQVLISYHQRFILDSRATFSKRTIYMYCIIIIYKGCIIGIDLCMPGRHVSEWSTAPCILTLIIRGRSVLSFTFRQLYR